MRASLHHLLPYANFGWAKLLMLSTLSSCLTAAEGNLLSESSLTQDEHAEYTEMSVHIVTPSCLGADIMVTSSDGAVLDDTVFIQTLFFSPERVRILVSYDPTLLEEWTTALTTIIDKQFETIERFDTTMSVGDIMILPADSVLSPRTVLYPLKELLTEYREGAGNNRQLVIDGFEFRRKENVFYLASVYQHLSFEYEPLIVPSNGYSLVGQRRAVVGTVCGALSQGVSDKDVQEACILGSLGLFTPMLGEVTRLLPDELGQAKSTRISISDDTELDVVTSMCLMQKYESRDLRP